MKTVNKLAAAVAIALSVGVASQAMAKVELKHDGKGDALLFPIFQGDVENYITIMNDSLNWIQGHIRFRGAAWSGELLDHDVILSPGDVMVFRVADVDGDGFWEIDQSLDPKNFAYTGMLQDCQPEGGVGVAKQNCIDQSSLLIPTAGGSVITQQLINYHRQQGYIEFIGEGILEGMTHARMNSLIEPSQAGKLAAQGQRRVGNRLGTHLWSWTDADGARSNKVSFGNDLGASDIPNELSGTAFITIPGAGSGLVYNAEAFTDFRTSENPHRVDNYPPETAVIIHDENAAGINAGGVSGSVRGPSPFGDYAYGWPFIGDAVGGVAPDDRADEARLGWDNAWGPSLVDGDDYNLAELRVMNGENDDWDTALGVANSIAEVEEAIRTVGQRFSSFYFDSWGRRDPVSGIYVPSEGMPATFDAACQGNGRHNFNECSTNSLTSWYYVFFPTKHFYGEDAKYYSQTSIGGYMRSAIERLMNTTKPIGVEIWDIEEHTPQASVTECVQSPCSRVPPAQNLVLAREGSFFSVGALKGIYPANAFDNLNYSKGRVVLEPNAGANANNPLVNGGNPKALATWPFFAYTFDVNPASELSHWRRMQK